MFCVCACVRVCASARARLRACARLCVLTNQSFHISARADIRKLQQLSDGTCNAIPAWEVTLNPQSAKNDPDCKAFPFYDELGLGDGASYGGGKVLRIYTCLSMSSSLPLALPLSRWLSRALSLSRSRSLTLSYLFSPSLSRS